MEHIDITTRLMRQADQHSRVTAPVLLLGGLFSVVIGTASSIYYNRLITDDIASITVTPSAWLLPWAIVLILTLIALVVFVSRYSNATNQNILSPGFKTVLRSMLPSLLSGAIITSSVVTENVDSAMFTSPLLLVFYSLSLFSIRLFVPKSIRILSILTLALGLAFWFVSMSLGKMEVDTFHLANFYMIFGFGLLQIITGAGSLLFERSQLPPLKK
ncbi:hypothetical protein SAMN02745181_2282 [Rubritalea squalenifaciens DSM 18772]|uniref:Uncharacterized protein n=1 Tax=Rubritalea squalenifaciens DSM 18772 TaxID=1123071 RepID=A0A1M6L3Y5_9BACT|nr:hypothetical protein [Rubritalea squalenifaciens]SHJ65759.1 hypothetical protein SAMN02745181_2282 [Rubritalea squalenifaciens DSM 18772]